MTELPIFDIKHKLAAQMYTVRESTRTAKDFAEALTAIAKIGYPAVQLSAVAAMDGDSPEITVDTARELLDDNGLRCIATHRSWDNLTFQTSKEIDFHLALGCDYTAIGMLPQIYRQEGIDGYRRWTDEAAELSERLLEHGIRIGYHNHALEFEKIGQSRKSLYSEIVEGGKRRVYLELDVYWADHAGISPVRLIEALHGRLPVVHVKDKEVYHGEPVMAPVGEGNLDWPAIIPALEAAGTEWYAVEQDECQRDPFNCLRSSYEYLAG